jgi:hypothetical protein
MMLDFATISSLILDLEARPIASGRILFVTPMEDELLGAVIRLLKVALKPDEVPVLAPLVQREIYYRLLQSEHGGLLRRMTSDSGQMLRVAAAVDFLKRKVAEPIRMTELASRSAHESVDDESLVPLRDEYESAPVSKATAST